MDRGSKKIHQLRDKQRGQRLTDALMCAQMTAKEDDLKKNGRKREKGNMEPTTDVLC